MTAYAEDAPTIEMGVANMTFLLERMYADCAPGQFIREYTKNAIQAIEALQIDPEDNLGLIAEIGWTVWRAGDSNKLAIYDTGIGMTADQLVRNINSLSASGHQQGQGKNYGVGAKISAVPKNKEGILYFSLTKGETSANCLEVWYDPDRDCYGIKPRRHQGILLNTRRIDLNKLPVTIREAGHGTMVVFLGNTPGENTWDPPPAVPTPKRWLYRYLNGRFFRLPKGLEIKVNPAGDDRDPRLAKERRVVKPFGTWLDENHESKGTVRLDGASAHWWITKPNTDITSGHWPSLGFIGALWQDELYDAFSAGQGAARLGSFGVLFEAKRVAIIVEPDADNPALTSDTARARLLIRGESLPWEDWAAQFREKVPREIEELQSSFAAKTDMGDVRRNIANRLENLKELFSLPKYRRVRNGILEAEPDSRMSGLGGAPEPEHPDVESGTRNRNEQLPLPTISASTTSRRRRTDYLSGLAVESGEGVPAESVGIIDRIPDISWVSVEDGTRQPDFMEDRAASFSGENNRLLINADFRVFQESIQRHATDYSNHGAAKEVAKQAVREWYAQQLIEVVVGSRALLSESNPRWDGAAMKTIVSEESLTAAVLARSHVETSIKRIMRNRFTY
jgi:hypothetical protein